MNHDTISYGSPGQLAMTPGVSFGPAPHWVISAYSRGFPPIACYRIDLICSESSPPMGTVDFDCYYFLHEFISPFACL